MGEMSVIIYAVGILSLFFIAGQVYLYFENKKAKEWLAKNPSASKVYIKTLNLIVYQQTLDIVSIDDKQPVRFYELLGLKQGFYLVPGDHVIKSSFTTVRPGIFYKEVSTTYGPSENKVEIKEGVNYDYSFSTSKEHFTLKVRK